MVAGQSQAYPFQNAELLAKVDLRNCRDEIISTAVDALREVQLAGVSVKARTLLNCLDICPLQAGKPPKAAKRTSAQAAVSDARLAGGVDRMSDAGTALNPPWTGARPTFVQTWMAFLGTAS